MPPYFWDKYIYKKNRKLYIDGTVQIKKYNQYYTTRGKNGFMPYSALAVTFGYKNMDNEYSLIYTDGDGNTWDIYDAVISYNSESGTCKIVAKVTFKRVNSNIWQRAG